MTDEDNFPFFVQLDLFFLLLLSFNDFGLTRVDRFSLSFSTRLLLFKCLFLPFSN
jgi:hypothetical protein